MQYVSHSSYLVARLIYIYWSVPVEIPQEACCSPLLYLASLFPLKNTAGGSLLSMLTTQNTLINMKEVTISLNEVSTKV